MALVDVARIQKLDYLLRTPGHGERVEREIAKRRPVTREIDAQMTVSLPDDVGHLVPVVSAAQEAVKIHDCRHARANRQAVPQMNIAVRERL
jgi:hypothetical protein